MITDSESRYAKRGYSYRAQQVEGTLKFDLTTATRDLPKIGGVATYTAVQGDSFRTVARRYLGNEKFWWVIADTNPTIGVMKGCFGLDGGEIILIPTKLEITEY